MPVAHIGLAVSNLPASTAFFLVALGPLGYHYIGARGDQIGFGVREADFFLSPIDRGSCHPAPSHIAFQAWDRFDVRDFFEEALRAGGKPAGQPAYRGPDKELFNAAVLDLDGNTVEVICKMRDVITRRQSGAALYKQPKTTDKSDAFDDNSTRKRSSSGSDASRFQSHADRASSKGSQDGSTTKGLLESIIGAAAGAAGAAIAYAMFNNDDKNARNDDLYRRSSKDKEQSSTRSTKTTRPPSRDAGPRRSMLEMIGPTPAQMKRLSTSNCPPTSMSTRTYRAMRRSTTYPPPAGPPPRGRSSSRRSSHTESPRRASDTPQIEPSREHSRRRDSVISSSPKMESFKDNRRSRDTKEANHTRSSSTRERSRRHSAAKIPLPPSRADSFLSRSSRASSKRDKVKEGVPRAALRSAPVVSSDDETVVPDDSISCVGLRERSSQRRDRSSKHSGAEHGNKDKSLSKERSDANSESTYRPTQPARHSSFSYAARAKEQGMKDQKRYNGRVYASETGKRT